MPKPRIIKLVAGNETDVPIDEVWPSIVRIIRLARLATSGIVLSDSNPEHDRFGSVRLAYLQERLTDLEGLDFRK